MIIKIKKLNKRAVSPVYQTSHSCGMDLHACIDKKIILKPGQSIVVPTGLAISLPKGHEAQIRPRSGLAVKYCVTVLNSPGTIDADYRGEIGVILINHSSKAFAINHGDRIAQMVIAKYEKTRWQLVDKLDDTKRGLGGYGSTGK